MKPISLLRGLMFECEDYENRRTLYEYAAQAIHSVQERVAIPVRICHPEEEADLNSTLLANGRKKLVRVKPRLRDRVYLVVESALTGQQWGVYDGWAIPLTALPEREVKGMDIILHYETRSDTRGTYVVAEIPDRHWEPSDLKRVRMDIPSGVGVVLSGRAPIWVYGCLIHQAHVAKWVATYDPRLSGAVVVESHAKEVSVGEIVK